MVSVIKTLKFGKMWLFYYGWGVGLPVDRQGKPWYQVFLCDCFNMVGGLEYLSTGKVNLGIKFPSLKYDINISLHGD